MFLQPVEWPAPDWQGPWLWHTLMFSMDWMHFHLRKHHFLQCLHNDYSPRKRQADFAKQADSATPGVSRGSRVLLLERIERETTRYRQHTLQSFSFSPF